MDYHLNVRDEVRIFYVLVHANLVIINFLKQKMLMGKNIKLFLIFYGFGSWLEYYILQDAAYCLFCYHFKVEYGDQWMPP